MMRWLPSALTLAGLGCAGAALLHPDPTGPVAVALWMIAVLFDQLDGPLARRLRASSALGAHLDGVSDVIIYIAVPAAVVVAAGAPTAAALIYMMAAGLRMARELRDGDKGITLGSPALLFMIPHALLGWAPHPAAATLFAVLTAGLLLSPLRLRRRGPLWVGMAVVGPIGLVAALARAATSTPLP